MERKMIFSGLVSIIQSLSPIAIDILDITEKLSLSDDLSMDSILIISMITLSEEQFLVNIGDKADQVAELETIGDVINFIETLGNN